MRNTAFTRFTDRSFRPTLVLEAAAARPRKGKMDEMIAALLLTALRVALPVLVLMGIGTYVERRRRPGM
jgi:hypothetical protein